MPKPGNKKQKKFKVNLYKVSQWNSSEEKNVCQPAKVAYFINYELAKELATFHELASLCTITKVRVRITSPELKNAIMDHEMRLTASSAKLEMDQHIEEQPGLMVETKDIICKWMLQRTLGTGPPRNCFAFYLTSEHAMQDFVADGITFLKCETLKNVPVLSKEYKIAAQNSKISSIPYAKRSMVDNTHILAFFGKEPDTQSILQGSTAFAPVETHN
jgi:hypothetical protein